MIVKRVSPLTGDTHEMNLPIEEHQLAQWRRGMLIQHAMPQLTDDEREFVVSGLLPHEFDALFAEE